MGYSISEIHKGNERKTQKKSACIAVDIKSNSCGKAFSVLPQDEQLPECPGVFQLVRRQLSVLHQ
jgi:hypothetical protein